MAKVRIVTDSTSDLSSEQSECLGITVVPAYVQIGDQSFTDGVGLSRERFYADLPAMGIPPTTAVPPVWEFAKAYRTLAQETNQIISIVVSSLLSGMFNVAQLATYELPNVEIHVVDSQQVSMGLGWIATAAAEAAARGQTVQEILTLIDDMKKRVHVFAAFDTLEYLRRSGRVSWARARAAQVLNVKPLVAVSLGKVRDIGMVRTRARALERLAELTRALAPLERLAILHTHAPDVESLRAKLAGLCPEENTIVTLTTTLIGTHVGPRGLGVAAVTAR